jgi:FkbM family methyltransferase
MGLRRFFKTHFIRPDASQTSLVPQGEASNETPETAAGFDLPHPDQHFGCVTYSQHADDLIVLSVFTSMGVVKPTYLDIGAHHPFNISNTALFHERGCQGVNVEANPNLFKAFLTHRPLDVNLNVGVVAQAGEPLDFYMIDKWSGRNSFSKQMVEDFVAAYPQFQVTEVIKIPTMTVNDIIQKHAGGVFPDFLSIDVEGLDEEILRSIDYRVARPKVICVETVNATGERGDAGIKKFLESVGYFSLIRCGGNSVFVHQDFETLVR